MLAPQDIAEAQDKLKAAADLLDTYGQEAAGTAYELALKAAEILSARAK